MLEDLFPIIVFGTIGFLILLPVIISAVKIWWAAVKEAWRE